MKKKRKYGLASYNEIEQLFNWYLFHITHRKCGDFADLCYLYVQTHYPRVACFYLKHVVSPKLHNYDGTNHVVFGIKSRGWCFAASPSNAFRDKSSANVDSLPNHMYETNQMKDGTPFQPLTTIVKARTMRLLRRGIYNLEGGDMDGWYNSNLSPASQWYEQYFQTYEQWVYDIDSSCESYIDD